MKKAAILRIVESPCRSGGMDYDVVYASGRIKWYDDVDDFPSTVKEYYASAVVTKGLWNDFLHEQRDLKIECDGVCYDNDGKYFTYSEAIEECRNNPNIHGGYRNIMPKDWETR